MEFTVELNRDEVVKILTQNMARHAEIFQEAIDKYRQRAIAEFSARIDDMKAGKDVNTYVDLKKPADHTHDYENVINMLNHHVGDTVTVSEPDYINFILDQWSWTAQFLETASTYTGKRYR